jgi:site-specific recombinase XerD
MRVSENLSILFLLEMGEMSKDGRAPIYARITVNSTRREMSLGIKIFPEQWDQKTALVNGPDAGRINKLITKTKARLEQLELVLSAKYECITADMLKEAYKGTIEKKEEVKERTLCQIFNFKYSKFAALVKEGLRSENTLKRWRVTKRKIRAFLNFKYKKWDIPLSKIQLADSSSFLHFLLTQHHIEENTARKYLKNTKELLQIAEDRLLIPKNPWGSYKIGYDQPERECLTMQEITLMHQKRLIDRLDHVRNIFLFACFTGYAFQEVLDLSRDAIFIGIDGKRWVKIDRKKTGKPECMPLLPIPAGIVDRYANDPYCTVNNKLLPVKSYKNYNGYLKEVAHICEISINLSTHIARHTFATTICLDHDVPIETVSRMLGHTNIRTTQIYAKVSRKKISNNMDELEKNIFTQDGVLIVAPIVKVGQVDTAIAV